MNQRMIYTRDERTIQALDAGVKLAQESGVKSVPVSAIARECNVTAPLLFHIFGNRDKMHEAIKRHARKKKVKLPADTAKAAKKQPKAPAAAKKPARKRSVKDKAAGKRPAAKKSPKPAATKRASGGRSAAAKTAGGSKRFKTQPAPAADVATAGDAPSV